MKEKKEHKNLALFRGGAVSDTMAEDIVEELNLNYHECLIKRFPDSEIYVRSEETVRGKFCFIIQPVCQTEDRSANDNLMELLLSIDALKRASAKKIDAVIPYYGYARQERKTIGREPISAKLVANLIEVADADRVLTVDLHSGAIQGFFDIPVVNLSSDMDDIMGVAVSLLKEEIASDDNVVIGSLDVGGAKKARKISEKVGCGLIIIEKKRNNEKDVENQTLIGEVKDRNVIFIDDIVSTAGSLVEGAKSVKREGANKIYAAITHGLFAGDAVRKIENSPIEKVIVTDSIPPSEKVSQSSKIDYVKTGQVIGRVIHRIYNNMSVSEEYPHT